MAEILAKINVVLMKRNIVKTTTVNFSAEEEGDGV